MHFRPWHQAALERLPIHPWDHTSKEICVHVRRFSRDNIVVDERRGGQEIEWNVISFAGHRQALFVPANNRPSTDVGVVVGNRRMRLLMKIRGTGATPSRTLLLLSGSPGLRFTIVTPGLSWYI